MLMDNLQNGFLTDQIQQNRSYSEGSVLMIRLIHHAPYNWSQNKSILNTRELTATGRGS